MTLTHVDDIEFTVMGRTGDVWKETPEEGYMTIIGKDGNGVIIISFVVPDTTSNADIITKATARYNAKGWY